MKTQYLLCFHLAYLSDQGEVIRPPFTTFVVVTCLKLVNFIARTTSKILQKHLAKASFTIVNYSRYKNMYMVRSLQTLHAHSSSKKIWG